jgi:hypothetical protein
VIYSLIEKERLMLKVFRGVTEFFANGTVYITDGERTQRFEKHNYQIENLKNDGAEMWIQDGVVVALGACTEVPDAIGQLKALVKHLEFELKEARLVGEGCTECGRLIGRTTIKR